MTTVAIGSSWQHRFHPSKVAKVVHSFDHALIDGDKTRFIVFEVVHAVFRAHREPRRVTGGLEIMSKSDFLITYRHPDTERPEGLE